MRLAACVAVVLVSAVATRAVTGVLRADRTAARAAASSGPVTISNSKAGTPILSAANLKPGSQTNGTVEIGNPSDVPVALRLAQDPVHDTPGPGGGRLSSALTLRIEQLATAGGAAGSVVYSGPLTGLTSLPVGTLDPQERRTYRFIVTWPDGAVARADDAFQGSSVSLGYHWAGANGFSAASSALKPALRVRTGTVGAGSAHSLGDGVAVDVTCPAACDVTAELLLGRNLARHLGIPVGRVVAARAEPRAAVAAAPARYVVVGVATVHLKAAGRSHVVVRLRPDVQRRLRGVHAIHLVLRSQLFDLSGQLQASVKRAILFTGEAAKRPAPVTTPPTGGSAARPAPGSPPSPGTSSRPTGSRGGTGEGSRHGVRGPTNGVAHRGVGQHRPSVVQAQGFWAVWWHGALVVVVLAALAGAGWSRVVRRRRQRDGLDS
jgi:spore coat-associated protein N